MSNTGYAGKTILFMFTSASQLRTWSDSRITREGNKYIRWILIEEAQNVYRHDPKLRGFYQQIAARRGHQKAVTAGAVILWSLNPALAVLFVLAALYIAARAVTKGNW